MLMSAVWTIKNMIAIEGFINFEPDIFAAVMAINFF